MPLKSSTCFTLKGINTTLVDHKYKLTDGTNIDEPSPPPPKSTPIQDLNIPTITERRSAAFLYTSSCITMVDSVTNQRLARLNCYWCRHPFDTEPIGCPLQYKSDQLVQTHTSEITGEQYHVGRLISEHEYDQYSAVPRKDETYIARQYYITEGCFCSFNCCMAYIEEHHEDVRYVCSKSLLIRMHSKFYTHTKPGHIHPAPSWQLLTAYGGFMTIEEFRQSFCRYQYTDTHRTVTCIPRLQPIGSVFCEQLIL